MGFVLFAATPTSAIASRTSLPSFTTLPTSTRDSNAGHRCVVLIVGGHYTYARVPLGDWAMHAFGWTRNNYDKLGHFTQGFVPAILTREILLRSSPLGPTPGRTRGKPSRWLPFLVVSVCLAFSACYELIEWLTAVSTGAAAEDFLGTQGDPWDTQTDMAFALIGAICALAVMSRLHDRSLARIAPARLATTNPV